MSKIQLLAEGPEPSGPDGLSLLPHVLLVVDGFPKALGGGERIVLRLAALLPHYGFRASILTFALHPHSSFRPADAPCAVYLLPLKNTFGPRAVRGAFALRRFLRGEKVQIVQTFFESSDLWAGLVTRLFSPAKLVWSRRDMGILRQKKHHLAYRALRHLPHAVVAVSARVADHVVRMDGIPADRVHIIHNGLDLDTTAPASAIRSDSGPVITTIGNIRKVKGHDLLVKAAPDVLAQFPSATFTIAGEVLEPEFFADLERMVAQESLSEKIRFLGKVTDLRKHLAAADIFVLPSRSEGFSNALIEAMAAGLPCIATDVGGNGEAIQDGQSGVIIPPDDPARLSQAILGLLRDGSLAARLRVAARHSAEENFSSEAMLRKVNALFRTLLRQ